MVRAKGLAALGMRLALTASLRSAREAPPEPRALAGPSLPHGLRT